MGAALDCLAEQAEPRAKKAPTEELLRVAGLIREMIDLGWEMTAAKRARLLSILAILKEGHSDIGAARFGAAALRASERSSARIAVLLHRSKGTSRDAFEGQLKPAVAAFAEELSKHSQDIQWGVVVSPAELLQGLTSDIGQFKATVLDHEFKAGNTFAAKALKKTLELFRQEKTDLEPSRLVFNFAFGAPDNLRDAQKAFQRLDADGVLVVGVAVAPADVHQLQHCCSPGLAFQVADLASLGHFLAKAAGEIENVLATADALAPDEVLQRFDAFA